MQVTGTLTSKPNTTFTIEFFANDTSGASGHFFLGFENGEDERGGRGHLHLHRPAAAQRGQLRHGHGDRPEQQHVGVLGGGVVTGR